MRLKRVEKHDILVVEHGNIWKYGILNFETKTIKWESKLSTVIKALKRKGQSNTDYSGLSQKIGTLRLTIFRYNKRLYFLSNKNLIELDDSIQSNLSLPGTDIVFSLSRDEEILFKHSNKQIKSIIEIKDDPTPFVDAEDFDLRILIHNVQNDKERRNRFFSKI